MMTLKDIAEINDAARALDIMALPPFIEARDASALCKLVRDGAEWLFYALASDGDGLELNHVIADGERFTSIHAALTRQAQFWRDEYGVEIAA